MRWGVGKRCSGRALTVACTGARRARQFLPRRQLRRSEGLMARVVAINGAIRHRRVRRSGRSWHRRSERRGRLQFEVDGERTATGSGGAERGDGGSWHGDDAVHSVRRSRGVDVSRCGRWGRLEVTASTRLLLTPSSEERGWARGRG